MSRGFVVVAATSVGATDLGVHVGGEEKTGDLVPPLGGEEGTLSLCPKVISLMDFVDLSLRKHAIYRIIYDLFF